MCARLGFSFQDSYCRVLVRYKEELSRPFDEAASFLSSIQAQLSNLCSGGSSPAATTATHSGKETHASIYGLAKKKKLARHASIHMHGGTSYNRKRTW